MLVPAPWLFSFGDMSFQGSKDVAVLAGFCARFIHRAKLEVRTMEEASWAGKILYKTNLGRCWKILPDE